MACHCTFKLHRKKLQTSTYLQIPPIVHQSPRPLHPRSGCFLIHSVFFSSQTLRRGRLTEAPHWDYISNVHSDNVPTRIYSFIIWLLELILFLPELVPRCSSMVTATWAAHCYECSGPFCSLLLGLRSCCRESSRWPGPRPGAGGNAGDRPGP